MLFFEKAVEIYQLVVQSIASPKIMGLNSKENFMWILMHFSASKTKRTKPEQQQQNKIPALDFMTVEKTL